MTNFSSFGLPEFKHNEETGGFWFVLVLLNWNAVNGDFDGKNEAGGDSKFWDWRSRYIKTNSFSLANLACHNSDVGNKIDSFSNQ